MKEWGPQKLLNLWTFFQLWLKQQDFHLWTNVLNQVMISNCVPKEKVWHHYLRYSFWTSIPWFIECSALMFAIFFNLIRGHPKKTLYFGVGCTLDLFALNPFKLQYSLLVSLWKPSHCGYKKWYFHFYSCQINKSDIWLQFEKNEKNPPEGADMQKNQKQILKLLYLHYWSAPRGPRGVKRCAKIH